MCKPLICLLPLVMSSWGIGTRRRVRQTGRVQHSSGGVSLFRADQDNHVATDTVREKKIRKHLSKSSKHHHFQDHDWSNIVT